MTCFCAALFLFPDQWIAKSSESIPIFICLKNIPNLFFVKLIRTILYSCYK